MQFKEKMENCTVFFNDKLIYLGDVEPGQTVEVGNYPVLEYPQNHSFDVASYLSGQSAFDQADIEDDAYVEAVEKTNLLSFYLDYYMPSYLSAARVVGIKTNSGSHSGLIRAGDVEGRTVASSNVDVYSSEDEILYRQATQRQPKVISGNYDENSNALFGMDPVTLEAAQLDGCTDIQYLFKVVLPLSKAVLAVLVLFYGVAHWNTYFNAMIYLRNRDLFPLTLFLKEILISGQIDPSTVSDPELAEKVSQLAGVIKYSLIVVSMVPVMIIYPFVQKYFVKGVTIGAVKG